MDGLSLTMKFPSMCMKARICIQCQQAFILYARKSSKGWDPYVVRAVVAPSIRPANVSGSVRTMICVGDRELILPALSPVLIVAISLSQPVRGTYECRFTIDGNSALHLASRSRALVEICSTRVSFGSPFWVILIHGCVIRRIIEKDFGDVVVGEHRKRDLQVIYQVIDSGDVPCHKCCTLERIVARQVVQAVDVALCKLFAGSILNEFAIGNWKEGPCRQGSALGYIGACFDECRCICLDEAIKYCLGSGV